MDVCMCVHACIMYNFLCMHALYICTVICCKNLFSNIISSM